MARVKPVPYPKASGYTYSPSGREEQEAHDMACLMGRSGGWKCVGAWDLFFRESMKNFALLQKPWNDHGKCQPYE